MILVPSAITLFFIAVFIIHPIPCKSLKCYECSETKSCGQGETDHIVDCNGKCMIYRNNGTLIRGCCLGDCNAERYPTYICSRDMCNGIHSDRKLISPMKINADDRISVRKSSEQQNSSLSCYECNDHNPKCGNDKETLVHGCRTCMVYQNAFDGNNVIRRCCTSGCGTPGTVGEYDGRKTYFCSSNECNGNGAEEKLTGEGELSSTTTAVTALSSTGTIMTTKTTTSITTPPTTVQTSFSCYECLGLNEQQCTTTTSNCPTCMVYRNDNDPTKFDRRCCWWGCGAPNQITNYGGRPTYFCNADRCNGPGSESTLGYITTTSRTTAIPSITTTIPSITTTTTTMTTATPQKTSSQCYDCSGPNCGKEGSSLSMSCPSCMVYRNPNDQTKIERRCCWWQCGPSNSVSMHNGMETYFCTADKCNGYGAESALGLPVTTTTTTATTTITSVTAASTTTTSSVSSTCVLNCQNGGTAETEDGCFCYCLDNTNGRECENVDCAQSDTDSETCSVENQSLCEESETFAFECLHLCGKC